MVVRTTLEWCQRQSISVDRLSFQVEPKHFSRPSVSFELKMDVILTYLFLGLATTTSLWEKAKRIYNSLHAFKCIQK